MQRKITLALLNIGIVFSTYSQRDDTLVRRQTIDVNNLNLKIPEQLHCDPTIPVYIAQR